MSERVDTDLVSERPQPLVETAKFEIAHLHDLIEGACRDLDHDDYCSRIAPTSPSRHAPECIRHTRPGGRSTRMMLRGLATGFFDGLVAPGSSRKRRELDARAFALPVADCGGGRSGAPSCKTWVRRTRARARRHSTTRIRSHRATRGYAMNGREMPR